MDDKLHNAGCDCSADESCSICETYLQKKARRYEMKKGTGVELPERVMPEPEIAGVRRVDPTKPTQEPFKKYDHGKLMMTLVDPDFIVGVADILTFGAYKYSKNNWQKNTDIDRYKDSTMRHMYAYLSGEMCDQETGKPHLDHIAANLMFLRYFEHGKGKD